MRVSKKTRARRKSVKALDDAARLACFERDGYKSVKSGNEQSIQWCHIFSRRDKRLRWHPDNTITLTAGEHKFWWHGEPAEAMTWFMDTYPDRYQRLMEIRQTIGKVTDKGLKEMAANL